MSKFDLRAVLQLNRIATTEDNVGIEVNSVTFTKGDHQIIMEPRKQVLLIDPSLF